MNANLNYTGHEHLPEHNGDSPASEAFGKRLDRVRNAQEAFDLLVQVGGSERAESALMDELDRIHNNTRDGDDERVNQWYRGGLA